MNTPKETNIIRRLIFGFCVLISIFLLFGVFTLYYVHRISDLSRTIYNHPLVVSNAALQANLSIAKMHRSMKDIVLSRSSSRIQQSIETVNEEEKQVYKNLDITKNRILGEEGKALENEARNIFDAWRPIRKEVIGLVAGDQREKAAAITTGKGANHVALLEEKMIGLTEYARKKASDFMHESERIQSKLNIVLIFLLLLGTLTSFLVAFFTIKNVSSAEKELQESENNLRALMENVPAGVTLSSPEGVVFEANLTALKLFGYDSKEDFFKTPASSHYYDKKERERFVELHKKGLSKDFESQFIRKDGTVFWGTVTSLSQITATGATLYLNVFQDITERKRAEEVLRQSERELSISNRIAKIFITIPHDKIYYEVLQIVLETLESPYGTFAYINENGDRVTPTLTRDIWVDCEVQDADILFPRETWRGIWGKCLTNKETVISSGPFRVPEGHVPITRAMAVPIIYQGEAIGNFMVANKTTGYGEEDKKLLEGIADKSAPILYTRLQREIQDNKRKLAEEALRESEEKYRTILESIQDGYFEVDIAGNFTFFNDSMCEILGYSKDELMGMNNRQYTDEENAKKLYQTFNTVYTTGKSDKGFDWEIIRKDGSKKYIEASVSLRKDSGDHPIGFRGIARDVSERRQAEEEKARLESHLQQSQKMEAIATLAGGVAHEFNNALMGIMGNIELLKMDLPEDEGRDRYFEAMNSSGHRMSRLTDQLLAYARGGKYQPKDLRLDDFVRETLPILQHNFSPAVRVETHFPKDISYIKADYAQMQMALSSILTNSNEAIEDKGLIKITAGNEDVDEDFTKQHPGLKPGPYVCLTIEDDGKGMDEETRSGIFDPFFTTKFQGRGMGMAAVYGIIKSHDGAITVESEPGKGTVVRIFLPAIEAKEEVKKEMVPRPTVELATGEGTILVIEDEEPLVELFRQILERLGYRVLEARTGKEAVEFAKTFDGQIDLALLDIKLPDMDGGRVYPLIMEARPDLKVIVCSGYSIHGPAQAILDAGAEGFIQKPFSIAPFAEKLKEVLEGK